MTQGDAAGDHENSVAILEHAPQRAASCRCGGRPIDLRALAGLRSDYRGLPRRPLEGTVVHADDLAATVALPSPQFGDDIAHPVVALLGMLSAKQHGSGAAVRTLARAERSNTPTGAFERPSR